MGPACCIGSFGSRETLRGCDWGGVPPKGGRSLFGPFGEPKIVGGAGEKTLLPPLCRRRRLPGKRGREAGICDERARRHLPRKQELDPPSSLELRPGTRSPPPTGPLHRSSVGGLPHLPPPVLGRVGQWWQPNYWTLAPSQPAQLHFSPVV